MALSLAAGAWGVGYGLGRDTPRAVRVVKVRRVKPLTDSLSAKSAVTPSPETTTKRVRVAEAGPVE